MKTWMRAKINQIIKKELDGGKKFVICPYGEWGMEAVNLLKKAYGVEDILILDNGLAGYNAKIHYIKELKTLYEKNMVLILTSISAKNNEDIEQEIANLNLNIQVRNILRPDITEQPQRFQEYKLLKELLSCKKVVGKELVRIGGPNGDGGYIMADDFKGIAHAYSLGIGNNVSWDMDIANKGIDVFMYDHTIHQLPQVHNRFHFYKIGAGSGDNCLSLQEILTLNDDLNNRNLILKVDIEGAEWEVLDNTSSNLLNDFAQISIELHDMCNIDNMSKIKTLLEKINVTHQAIWVHGNNGNWAESAEGILIPNLIEVTYLRKDSYEFLDAECEFPMELDLPNLAYRYDFILGNWGKC